MPSSVIAGSLNINPVLVRNEISELKKMGFVESKEGKNGGLKLKIPANKIFLSDIFNLVKGDDNVLGFSKNDPNPNCPIGKNINNYLSNLYTKIDSNIESTLKDISLEEFKNQFFN